MSAPSPATVPEETTGDEVVLVVATDARPVMRAGLQTLLGDGTGGVVVEAVCDPSDVVDAVRSLQPAVLVVSVNAGEVDPWLPVVAARAVSRRLGVLALTDAVPSIIELRGALAAGVDSFLLTGSSPDEIRDGVVATARGDRAVSGAVAMHLATAWHDPHGGRRVTQPLTGRELDVVVHLADGLTNAQIAAVLDLQPRTVKTHIQRIMTKLDSTDRTGVVARAFRLGLIR